MVSTTPKYKLSPLTIPYMFSVSHNNNVPTEHDGKLFSKFEKSFKWGWWQYKWFKPHPPLSKLINNLQSIPFYEILCHLYEVNLDPKFEITKP
jgi:hypothetical protein